MLGNEANPSQYWNLPVPHYNSTTTRPSLVILIYMWEQRFLNLESSEVFREISVNRYYWKPPQKVKELGDLERVGAGTKKKILMQLEK